MALTHLLIQGLVISGLAKPRIQVLAHRPIHGLSLSKTLNTQAPNAQAPNANNPTLAVRQAHQREGWGLGQQAFHGSGLGEGGAMEALALGARHRGGKSENRWVKLNLGDRHLCKTPGNIAGRIVSTVVSTVVSNVDRKMIGISLLVISLLVISLQELLETPITLVG